MKAPVDTIVAPLFPTKLPWVNAGAPGQASIIQRGRPMLVEFWDFCRPNSIRTLPYLKEWHARYAEAGLRVIGVHCPGFAPSRDEDAVRGAVERLGVSYPVLIDGELEVWREYGNEGWPARYHGEGGYAETELAIQEQLDVVREPLAPVRPEDAPGARLVAQTADQAGPYAGRYEAGGVWLVLDGAGTVSVNGGADAGGWQLSVTAPGAYPLIEHARHTKGALELAIGPGLECLATCFTPGLA